MKQAVIYIFMSICIVFMVILINKNEKTLSPKVLTVDTYYSYLDVEGEFLYIDFYLSTQLHPLTDIKSYGSTVIHDEDDEKSLHLTLDNVIFRHQETYLNDTYYKYTYAFEMPVLGHDFDILECYLETELTNGVTYDFYIGSLSLKTVVDDSEHLSWTSLSGIKKPESYLSRLHEITIDYEKLDISILSVSVGSLYDVSFEVKDHQIILSIPYQAQLFNACPITITFTDYEVEVFNYFIYINDYEVLKQSGQLIYHYALD
ncbi:hypothetical protein BK010_05150 [Tenericutes bacterium MO-XQ]|nr:hypothetical protein BK010_05150 [Tenericutes bacterium MO-XQ]